MNSDNRNSNPPPDPPDYPLPKVERTDERRNKPGGPENPRVDFVERGISPERLQALRAFLARANSDDIATIRRIYGDNPEVLKMIGIELFGGFSTDTDDKTGA